MKNFNAGKSTIGIQLPNKPDFVRAKDFVGKYKKGEMQVCGYIKTHSELYNKDSYSLAVIYKNEGLFLNVPAWYGEQLDKDFRESGQDAEEYFADSFVKEISTFTTKFNTESVKITVFED